MNTFQKVSPFSNVFAVFPGQGSQHVGMAKELYDNFSIAKQVFEEASDAIHVNLKTLCFQGPDSELNLTENTQPCLLAASIAAFRVAEQELHFIPGGVAGHSLGEYTALVAAGSLNLSTAIIWVRYRGAAMQRAVPSGEGTMAAIIGLEDQTVEILCQKATESSLEKRQKGEYAHLSIPAVVAPANFNAPGQVVIAGSEDAVQSAIALLKSDVQFRGGKAIPLSVSAPFHCSLMHPAKKQMTELFSVRTQTLMPLKIPYIPNRTGRISNETNLILTLLIEQMDHPVLWKQSMLTFLDAQFSTAVEFGPGKVLSGLMKRIANHTSKSCNLVAVNDTASFKNLESVVKNLEMNPI